MNSLLYGSHMFQKPKAMSDIKMVWQLLIQIHRSPAQTKLLMKSSDDMAPKLWLFRPLKRYHISLLYYLDTGIVLIVVSSS